MREDLKPLKCSRCAAPVPLGEADDATCPACGQTQPLPPDYRELRDARRLSTADAQALDELVRDVATPAPAWKTTMMWVGYVVGVATVVVLAIGALVGALAGLFASDKLDGRVATVLMAIFAVGGGIISVPFVGEVIFHSARLHDLDLAIALATSGVMEWHIEAGVGLVLYVFSVVPIALARKTQLGLVKVESLRAELTARPAMLKGGVRGCRACGAPLTVASGALMARCTYCGTDSLVAIGAKDSHRGMITALSSHRAVDEAVASWQQTRAEDRDLMMKLLVGGPALVPFVCLGGALLHVLAA
jgi:DNA-directed RNA polymerase subunit RPC12/RpoP